MVSNTTIITDSCFKPELSTEGSSTLDTPSPSNKTADASKISPRPRLNPKAITLCSDTDKQCSLQTPPMLLSEITQTQAKANPLLKFKKLLSRFKYILLTIIILTALYFAAKSPWGSWALDATYKKIVQLLDYDKVWFVTAFFIFHFFYNLTFLPGHTYFFVLMPYLLKDLWLSFAIIFLSYECSVVAGYFTTRWWFLEKFKKRWSGDYRFKMIKDSVKKRPIGYSSLCWMIIIPDIMKMILLVLADVGFWTYFLTSIPQYALQSFLYAFTGTTLKDFKDKSDHNGGFWNMTVSEKVQFVSTCFFIIASFVIIFVWGVWITRKMNQYKLLEMEKEKLLDEESSREAADAEIGNEKFIETTRRLEESEVLGRVA